MIAYQFADAAQIEQIIPQWCRVFGDSPEYVRAFYAHWQSRAKILTALDGGKVVGFAHMLPMTMRVHNEMHPAYYMYAGAVEPSMRNQGIFTALLKKGQAYADAEGAYQLYKPATESLFSYYPRFGCRTLTIFEEISVPAANCGVSAPLCTAELTAQHFSDLSDRFYRDLPIFPRWDADALQYAIAEIRSCGGFAKQFTVQGADCAAVGYAGDHTLHLRTLIAPDALRETAYQMLMQHFQCSSLTCRVPAGAGGKPDRGMLHTPDGSCPDAVFFPFEFV